ncbi:TVG0538221 [Thermoplasma volcanium GSS1]|uniref:TVG0538221 protein n=1 Tax=Thermoplasma volcanium (strain ATCC 51530 / DSM 4299 / JCM 9571 / NBRC 15438 / GSS1) TaxID=273116 RepID=Q97BA9_THEVO|nr:hypothetical protein [Thermoplasma volcanium]BAB59690.1 TVG0538221 [Thermoplasma volcanium GSS1]
MDKICDVVECSNERFKTVPAELAKKVFSLKTDKTKVHLCKEHYKEYKKKTKEERDVDRADWI